MVLAQVLRIKIDDRRVVSTLPEREDASIRLACLRCDHVSGVVPEVIANQPERPERVAHPPAADDCDARPVDSADGLGEGFSERQIVTLRRRLEDSTRKHALMT